VQQVAELFAADGLTGDRFGDEVSISGDRILAGAPYKSNRRGAAYLFERDSTGAWSEQAKLTASDGVAFDYFSASLDVDGDRAVIGKLTNFFGGEQGKAYVFERDSAGSWVEVAILLASELDSGFGNRVALDGDLLVTGAIGDDDLGSNAGSLLVYERDALGVWAQSSELHASDGQPNDRLGKSVDVSGLRAVAGSSHDDPGSYGATYVFERDAAGAWSQIAKLVPSDGSWPPGTFGEAVALEGDRVLVGSPKSGQPGTPIDQSYLYERNEAGQWAEVAILHAFPQSSYGIDVAFEGELAVVGAPGHPFPLFYGSAYLYGRAPGGAWTLCSILLARDYAYEDTFGTSVDLSSDLLAIGAPLHSGASPQGGAVYVLSH
jgi:hypothetical protein